MTASSKIAAGLALVLAVALPSTARAQEPKFEKFEAPPPAKPDPKAKPKDPNAVEWKAQLKAGLLVTSGNSQQVSFSGAGNISRKSGNNKFGLEGGWAYARSNPLTATDANGNGFIEPSELNRTPTTTANLWNLKGRYDRFFFTSNSVYAVAQVGADTVAGKQLIAGAQAGYSRILYKDLLHEVAAELGYDFSYEKYDQLVTMGPLSSNSIHSIRFFGSYKLTISKTVGAFVTAEGLFNLNTEIAPTADGSNTISPFIDGRFNGKTGLTFNIWRNINFGLTFTLRYDNRPAPLPVFNPLTPFSAGFVPIAQKLDTITEAQVIINFL